MIWSWLNWGSLCLLCPSPPAFDTSYTLSAEKAMAPHSSTLAWKIPWMEEPGRLQSMGSWRVGHDWATSLSLFTFLHWRRKWQPTPVFLPGESQGREPGGLLSMGSHRVGQDGRDLAVAVAGTSMTWLTEVKLSERGKWLPIATQTLLYVQFQLLSL